MTARPRLRLAGLDEMALLVHQRRAMFEAMGHSDAVELDRADREYARWYRRQHRLGRIQAFVAELPGQGVIGGGAVWLQERHPWPGFPGGRLPYLMSFYTEPRARGRGIASALVQRALAWCRARGFSSMSLQASAMGRRIYERLGFTASSEHRLALEPAPGRVPRARGNRELAGSGQARR